MHLLWRSRTRPPGPYLGFYADVHVTAADLHDEQAVQPLQRHCAVQVEEIGGEHRRCPDAHEPPPRGVSTPFRCRGIFSAVRTRRMVDAPTR